MSADREATRIVRSWLEDGVTRLPDNVLDAVLDQLPSTHQRRATWWPVRRLLDMNKTLALSAAAAAIVLVAIVGFGLLRPGGLNFGAPAETPIPTATPEPRALIEGAQGPGTFSTVPGGDNPDEDPPQIVFDMPEGWAANRTFFIGAENESGGANLFFIQPSGLHSDPCLANSGTPDVSVGSSAESFAAALAAHASYDAIRTGDVLIGGHDAIRMELETPLDLDYSTCERGQFWLWDAPLYGEEANRYDLWIIDLDGTTMVLLSNVGDSTSPELREQRDAIIDSLRIEP
jgi:hypothetical protein